MESSQDDCHLFSEFWENPGIPKLSIPTSQLGRNAAHPINESFRKLNMEDVRHYINAGDLRISTASIFELSEFLSCCLLTLKNVPP